MKIVTTCHGHEDWSAYDDDTYDGPGSVIGWGETAAGLTA
jgi:hypothetical protein